MPEPEVSAELLIWGLSMAAALAQTDTPSDLHGLHGLLPPPAQGVTTKLPPPAQSVTTRIMSCGEELPGGDPV